MKVKNRKGFTLVELLSVIVILSVVVLIATSAVIPMMSNAKKEALATEANVLIPFFKTLYSKGGNTGTRCITYQELVDAQLIDKNDDAYKGSFLVEQENGKITYRLWLSNGTNMIDGKSPDFTGNDVIDSSEDASVVCGK